MLNWFKGKKKEETPVVNKTEESEEEKDLDEEELVKQGFDPLQLKDIPQDSENTPIVKNLKDDYAGYLTLGRDEIIQLVIAYDHIPNVDEQRYWEAYKSGGKKCCDPHVVTKARSVGQEIIKDIGRKILSGNFNLTKISFPIKVSIPKTALETSVHGTLLFPLYLNRAAMTPDPLERFKLVVTAILGSFLWTNTFLKPLNPILGETLEAKYNDGTLVWAEQILHHPPVSYFLVYGPNKNYKYHGYYLIEAKAGMNSITILNQGKRSVVFKDDTKIDFDFPNELYSGTFLGTLRQETFNKIKFIDKGNNLSLELTIGGVKKKPSDYFEGFIMKNKDKISRIHGSYLSHINFDDIRYWDYREITPFKIQVTETSLESDHSQRKDLITLKKGDVQQAQTEKEILENLQRRDKKLREEYAKKNINNKK